MDRDPNHFPTLLTICVIIPIILYIISTIITFFHDRNLKNRQHPINNNVPLTPHNISDEEQQLANYLRNDKENL